MANARYLSVASDGSITMVPAVSISSGAGSAGSIPALNSSGQIDPSCLPSSTTGGTFGSATIDFGAPPGSLSTTTTVTGQTNILSTSNVQVWIAGDSTTAHSSVEHLLAGITANAINIVPGIGFTIQAFASFRVSGQFTIRWVWN